MKKLHIDFETYSDVDLRTAGMHRYVESPNFEILMCAFAFDDEPVQCIDFTGRPRDAVARFLKDLTLRPETLNTAHNAAFEMGCLRRYGVIVLRWIWRCTAVKATYLSLPRALGKLSEVMKLDKPKDKEGMRLINMFCKPRKPTKKDPRTRYTRDTHPEDWARFMQYCIRDVEAEREIDEKLEPISPPEFEWDNWVMDQEINDMGMLVDAKLVEGAIAIDKRYRAELMEDARELTGLLNPNSRNQFLDWVKVEMLDEEIDGLAKDEVKRLIGVTEDDDVTRALKIRQELSKTSVKKYASLRRGLCEDERLRGSLLFYGASRTHRWSGKIFQPHNLPQNHLYDLEDARDLVRNGNYEMLDFLYPSVSNVLSELIRTAIIPSKGRKFIVADFSAIEARVLAWLADEEWVLEVFRTHGKIYEATASQMFHVPFESVTKGSEMRRNGKVATLACGYGGGAGALEAMDRNKEIPEEEYEPLKRAWREANPNIVKWWWQVGNAAMDAIKDPKTRYYAGKVSFIKEHGFLFCDMPSGNRLCYPRPAIRLDPRYDKDQIVYEGTDQKHPQWSEIGTYGPKLVENITQSIARDLLVYGMQEVRKEGYDIVLHVHDEAVIDADMDVEVHTIEKLLATQPEWAKGLPLKADGFETMFYRKDG